MVKDSKLSKVRINMKDNYILGIFFIIISSLFFALIAVMVKQIKHLPLMEIMFFQTLPAMFIIPMFLKKMHISFLGNNIPFLLVVGFLGIIIELAKFYTFTVMLLADAITIQKLSPIFVFSLSGIFLKEKLNLRQIPLFLVAFFLQNKNHFLDLFENICQY
ncbi:MAG: DMT family transporter [Candidatus Lokiarchaeota archaeon]|nr:DMT family transporter [Candidatus Lokiarchaeota archaeon]